MTRQRDINDRLTGRIGTVCSYTFFNCTPENSNSKIIAAINLQRVIVSAEQQERNGGIFNPTKVACNRKIMRIYNLQAISYNSVGWLIMPESIKPGKEKSIGTIIKEARIRKGYTQSELSQRTGISVRTIGNIENGKQNPRYINLKILADVLDIPKTLFPQLEQGVFSQNVQQFLDEFIDTDPSIQEVVANAGRSIIKSIHEEIEKNTRYP